MKIVIKDNAADYDMAKVACGGTANYKWNNKLRKIQGMTLEVDTKHLFADQYNTAPIPGVSVQGLRIMNESVAAVIDDEREGRGRCGYCGKVVDIPTRATVAKDVLCPHCTKFGYVEPFAPFLKMWQRAPRAVPVITLDQFIAKHRAEIDRRYAADCGSSVAAHRRAGWCNDDERGMAVANVESLYAWAKVSGVTFE